MRKLWMATNLPLRVRSSIALLALATGTGDHLERLLGRHHKADHKHDLAGEVIGDVKRSKEHHGLRETRARGYLLDDGQRRHDQLWSSPSARRSARRHYGQFTPGKRREWSTMPYRELSLPGRP
ncbi:hypothetical protein MTO96_027384 [Rhipicephalus appendiculatus]